MVISGVHCTVLYIIIILLGNHTMVTIPLLNSIFFKSVRFVVSMLHTLVWTDTSDVIIILRIINTWREQIHLQYQILFYKFMCVYCKLNKHHIQMTKDSLVERAIWKWQVNSVRWNSLGNRGEYWKLDSGRSNR